MKLNLNYNGKDAFMHAGFTPALYLPAIDYSTFKSPFKPAIKAEVRKHMKTKQSFKTIFKQSF